MGSPVRRIIIARYKEDVSWINNLPSGWHPMVVQKATEEDPGDMPNMGREPSSFLLAIIKLYRFVQPDDTYAFVQGNPFDHAGNILIQLAKPINGYRAFQGSPEIDVTYEGNTVRRSLPLTSDGFGQPYHAGLPVAQWYERWFDRPFPGSINFHPGGQFLVRGHNVLSYPVTWYQQVYDEVMAENNATPYVMERLWESIFADQG